MVAQLLALVEPEDGLGVADVESQKHSASYWRPYPYGHRVRFTVMFAYYPQSQYQACPDCGAPVTTEEDDAHRCEQRRFVEYQMLMLRPEIVAFETQLLAWLDTAQGQFASYYAARERFAVAA